MGEIDETKDWFLNNVLPDIIKSGKLTENLKSSSENASESFKVIDLDIAPISLEEAFMLTKCYRLKLEFSFGGGKHTCCLIAKRTPKTSAENYTAVSFEILFHNEIAAYKTIIPALMETSKLEKKDYNCPTYYYSKVDECEASIVLGDFREEGFRMSKDLINLSLEHILLGAEHIGFFHGLCYALQAIDIEKFKLLSSLPQESRYAKPPPKEWEEMDNIVPTRIKQAVDKFYTDADPEFMRKLTDLMADHFNYSKKRVRPIEPIATLCHGDYLRNNIAFAYKDQENPTVPLKAMMFDFQTLRYASPMIDLCTFLTISTGKDIRVPNFDAIFDAYHQKLASVFTEHTKKELPDYLSRSNMLREYTLYLPYSLSIASFFLGNMYQPNNSFVEDAFKENFDLSAVMQEMLSLGGDKLDKEIASLVRELYELTVQNSVDVFEGFL